MINKAHDEQLLNSLFRVLLAHGISGWVERVVIITKVHVPGESEHDFVVLGYPGEEPEMTLDLIDRGKIYMEDKIREMDR